ncbi:MAG: glycosyltransferase [Planctomycetes bacterium]|nr:glycosyltransferase [Planctomycetota bacterium]
MTLRCSVVIPARDMASYIAEAIESVLAQEEPALEIVVVDDGSADATPDIAGRYGPDRVRVIREGRLGSVGAERNRGLREARGDAVVFLDADDRLAPSALRRFLRALERDPGLAVAYGEVLVVDAEGRAIGTGKAPLFRKRRPSGEILERLLVGTPVVTPGAACIRRKNLDTAGGFSTFPMGEDWELWCRLALTGRFSYLRGPPVLEYRRHPGSMTSTRAERFESLLPAIDAIYGNPALRARFPAWLLAARRRSAVAAAYGFVGRTALRNGSWDMARGNLLECLRRDPWRARELVLLVASLVKWLPGPLRRRIK